MPGYEFTEQAELDLETITDYTLENWGKAQAENYLEGLEMLVQSLADNPDVGFNRTGRDAPS